MRKPTFKIRSITVNMKKTNEGINYFTQRRDHYLRKSKQKGISDTLISYFKGKANDMQACIDRVVIRKTSALATFN